MRSKETFWKKPSSGWKKRFWPVFLVLPVMLLKAQVFEKELFCPSVFVRCSIKNLNEQLITAHNNSWHFFCILKLHSVRTYEADGDFSKKMLSFRWFWPVFSRITEYRDIRKQFHWPKKKIKQVLCKLRDQFCNNCVIVENRTFRKEVTFPLKKKHIYIFFVIPRFADVHKNFITLHKVFKQNWCK